MSALHARLPLLTASLLTVAMVGTIGWQGYRFWDQEQQDQSRQAAQQAPASQPQRQQIPDVQLATLDVFGKASAEATVASQDTENLPETNLRIFLRGVMAGNEELPGSALIEDDRSRTEVYIIGDELPGNARLRSVHANRIIIERGGALENLYFPELDDRRGVSLASVNDGAAQIEQTRAQPQAQPTSEQARPMGTQQATDERREEIRQRLEELRQRLRDNN